MPPAPSYHKDERYYIVDADVTILVSNVLFKVHRHVLARDESVFAGMFASEMQGVAADGFQQEGRTDERPIQLQGDGPEEFRDLLWCLYALPQEIATAMTPRDADIGQLVNVLRMAHKYHFITTESWLVKTIQTLLLLPEYVPSFPKTLVKISEAAVLVSDASLLHTIRHLWRGIIGDGENLALALTTAERLGLQDLQGLAYQEMVLKGREVWEQEPLLTRDQRIRLLSGYHNITIFANKIADNPPTLVDHDCQDPDQCAEDWESAWRFLCDFRDSDHESAEAIQPMITPAKLDLIKRSMMFVSILQAMKENPDSFEKEIHIDCINTRWRATLAFRDKLQQNMMDFFPDVN